MEFDVNISFSATTWGHPVACQQLSQSPIQTDIDEISIPPPSSFLQLNDNNICRIGAGAFERVPSLRTLALRNNRLTRIHEDAFGETQHRIARLEVAGQSVGSGLQCWAKKNGCEVARIFQAVSSRSGKQQHLHNSPNLGTNFSPIPVH